MKEKFNEIRVYADDMNVMDPYRKGSVEFVCKKGIFKDMLRLFVLGNRSFSRFDGGWVETPENVEEFLEAMSSTEIDESKGEIKTYLMKPTGESIYKTKKKPFYVPTEINFHEMVYDVAQLYRVHGEDFIQFTRDCDAIREDKKEDMQMM